MTEQETPLSRFKHYAGKTRQFIKRYGPALALIFALCLVVYFSTVYRLYPAYLPITDEWAERSVHTQYKNQITERVAQAYPHLPDANREKLVNDQFTKLLDERKSEIDGQINDISKQIKDQFQDDGGQTYMPDIDPWLWYSYALNKITYGHYGNAYKDGKSWFTLRNGRIGQPASFKMMSFLTAVNYNILNMFGKYSLHTAISYVPVILAALASIAAFFIGRKLGGYFVGLAAGVMIGLSPVIMRRTAAGFADTDILITFFEILVPMFFFLAFAEERTTKRWVYILLAALSLGFYTIGHQSWWHTLNFLMGALLIYLIFLFATYIRKHPGHIKEFLQQKNIQQYLSVFFGFGILGIFFTIFSRMLVGDPFFAALRIAVVSPFEEPLQFLASKNVAVSTIWPNVLTTVAELNPSSLNDVIAQLGGGLLFTASVIGILWLFVKNSKDRQTMFYGLFLLFWLASACFAARYGIRFIALAVPPYVFGLCVFMGYAMEALCEFGKKLIHVNPAITRGICIIVAIIIVFNPLAQTAHATGLQMVPPLNDAWTESITAIRDDSSDSIITSWWDFGHWFVALGQRRVTFDGGDQGERIHWVGKLLLTKNEQESVGILRMLNCAQEQAPHVLEQHLNGDTVRAIAILDKLFVQSREEARETLKNEGLSESAVTEVLDTTHCSDLLPNYLITSEDMVGKAGVWGHFGSWNFTKADMYNDVINAERDEGIRILKEKFNIPADEAPTLYNDLRKTNPDQYIAPWPGYQGNIADCSVANETITCANGLIVNTTSYDSVIRTQDGFRVPYSLTYIDNNTFVNRISNVSTTDVAVALMPVGNSYRSTFMDKLHGASMFNRLFFYQGYGLECFDQLSYKTSFIGNHIFVWKVNWECAT